MELVVLAARSTSETHAGIEYLGRLADPHEDGLRVHAAGERVYHA